MILRLLNVQGIAGLVAGAALALLLVLQHAETRRWRGQSERHATAHRLEAAAHAATVAGYRAAAEAARAADRANATRVAAEQSAINERTRDDFESRLADARARAASLSSERLRREAEAAASHSGSRASTAMPGLPAAPGAIAEAAGQDRLPDSGRLVATEQAIQLDELIKWVRRQSAVDPNRP